MKKSCDVSLKFAISFSDKFLQTFVEILSFQALFYCQTLSFLLYRSQFFELFFFIVCYYKVFHSISNKRFKEKKHFFRLDSRMLHQCLSSLLECCVFAIIKGYLAVFSLIISLKSINFVILLQYTNKVIS